MAAARDELQEEVGADVRALVDDDPDGHQPTNGFVGPSAPLATGRAPAAPPAGGAAPDERADEERRRAAIERLMERSARWGFQLAQSGTFRTMPRPVIRWDDDGEPHIAFAEGTAEQAAAATPSPIDRHAARATRALQDVGAALVGTPPDPGRSPYVQNLEEELRRLLRARAQLTSSGDLANVPRRFELDDLIEEQRQRLAAVYPQSGLL
jgi:hypothetical protein